MSSPEEEKRIVDNLAVSMLGKLRVNSTKTHWKSNGDETRKETMKRFLVLMRREVAELETAIESGSVSEIRLESSDVGNYSAMIFDLAGDDSPDAE